MSTPQPPPNFHVRHIDGTRTPLECVFIDKEPREVNGDIFIVDIWEVATVVAWKPGDMIDADDWPQASAIRAHRVGEK